MKAQRKGATGAADLGLVLRAIGCALVLLLDMALLVGGLLVVLGAAA